METSNRKIVISGDRVEYSMFQNFYEYGKREKKIDQQAGKSLKTDFEDLYKTDEQINAERERYKLSNRIRSQTNLVRLVNANKQFDRGRHSFLTLTYKENEQNITKAQRDFAKFIQRLNYSLLTVKKTGKNANRIRYVSVIEFQKRGAIHFHVILFDVSYIHWAKLTKLWGHGSIDINARDKSGKAMTVTKVAKYMAKYMAKGFTDERLNGKKKYCSSTNLEKPIIIREPAHCDLIRTHLHDPLIKHQRSYYSKFYGVCLYLVFEGVPIDAMKLLANEPPPPRYQFNDDW